MERLTCYPEMNADIVKFLRGLDETEHAAICLYAAQRIEDLERELRDEKKEVSDGKERIEEFWAEVVEMKSDMEAGAKLCSDRQDRINDLESVLFLASNTLNHIKADNDANAREAMVAGLMKTLLDETVLRINQFFEEKEERHGGEKP